MHIKFGRMGSDETRSMRHPRRRGDVETVPTPEDVVRAAVDEWLLNVGPCPATAELHARVAHECTSAFGILMRRSCMTISSSTNLAKRYHAVRLDKCRARARKTISALKDTIPRLFSTLDRLAGVSAFAENESAFEYFRRLRSRIPSDYIFQKIGDGWRLPVPVVQSVARYGPSDVLRGAKDSSGKNNRFTNDHANSVLRFVVQHAVPPSKVGIYNPFR